MSRSCWAPCPPDRREQIAHAVGVEGALDHTEVRSPGIALGGPLNDYSVADGLNGPHQGNDNKRRQERPELGNIRSGCGKTKGRNGPSTGSGRTGKLVRAETQEESDSTLPKKTWVNMSVSRTDWGVPSCTTRPFSRT